MTLTEQGKLVSMWHAYLGDEALARHARNVDMVSFYFDIVRESPMYKFGGCYEVFDVLINGPFDPEVVSIDRFAERIELKLTAA
jgi:hypothetical protein